MFGATPPHTPSLCAAELSMVREGYFKNIMGPLLSWLELLNSGMIKINK